VRTACRTVRISVALSLLLVLPAIVHAQDDGARAYQAAPAGTKAFSAFGIFTRGNKSLEPGTVVEGAKVDVNVTVLEYAHPIVLGTRLGGLFGVAPIGQVTGTLEGTAGRVSGSSSGLGDVQVGWVQNIVGPAAASGKEFVTVKPGFTVSTLVKVTLPTGDYDSSRVINLGVNHWAD
jgi:hypothetical protein